MFHHKYWVHQWGDRCEHLNGEWDKQHPYLEDGGLSKFQIIPPYSRLRTKLCSLLMVNDELEVSRKVARSGIKRYVLNRVLNQQRYLDCLGGIENGVVWQKTFKSKGHRLFTIETEWNAGTCYDNKRYFFEDKCRTSSAYGHYALR